MPETATVKRTLSRLAERSTAALAVGSEPFTAAEYRSVVTTAEDAVESVGAAVDFLADDGLDRLDAAIESADDAGDHAAARRGRRARAALTDFRRAVRADQFHRRYEADAPTLEVGEEADTR